MMTGEDYYPDWRAQTQHEQTALVVEAAGWVDRPAFPSCGVLTPTELTNDAGRVVPYPLKGCNRPRGHDGRHALSSMRHAREWEWE